MFQLFDTTIKAVAVCYEWLRPILLWMFFLSYPFRQDAATSFSTAFADGSCFHPALVCLFIETHLPIFYLLFANSESPLTDSRRFPHFRIRFDSRLVQIAHYFQERFLSDFSHLLIWDSSHFHRHHWSPLTSPIGSLPNCVGWMPPPNLFLFRFPFLQKIVDKRC